MTMNKKVPRSYPLGHRGGLVRPLVHHVCLFISKQSHYALRAQNSELAGTPKLVDMEATPYPNGVYELLLNLAKLHLMQQISV